MWTRIQLDALHYFRRGSLITVDKTGIYMNYVLMLQAKEIKCSARMYRSLKYRWIFALQSSEILYPLSKTGPQEAWSAITQVKRMQKRRKDQRSRK